MTSSATENGAGGIANGESRTTVLSPGVVEERNENVSSQKEQISDEIKSFLSGDAALGIRSEFRTFFTIWMFITRLPGPSWVDLHPGFLMRGMAYFPVVGTVLGIFYAIVLDFCHTSLGLPAGVAAAISITFGLFLTGCFHEDGLADSADGLGGGWSKSQILKIMTDSRVGTFGCAALTMFLLVKVQLLGSLGHPAEAIIVSQTLSRISSPFLIRTKDYVAEVGPKSPFYIFMVQAKHLVSWQRFAVAALYSFLVTSFFNGPVVALFLVVAVLLLSHVIGWKGDYLLGGVMGDFLGGTICICEILVLVLLLSKDALVELYQSFLKDIADAEGPAGFAVQIQLVSLWNDTRIRPTLVFLAMMISIKMWCKVVGGKDMYDREDASEFSSEAKVPSTEEQSNGGDPSPRQVASDIITSSGATFAERYEAAQGYLDALAKPVGSLGTLETWAAKLSALQRTATPSADKAACLIFAGDHGVAKAPEEGGEGCSLFPQAVTRAVLLGLEREVAGASVLAKANGVQLKVIDVGVAGGPMDGKVILSCPDKLPDGTRNFCKEPAMTAEECARCIKIGRSSLAEAVEKRSVNVVALGEVGIGNTTSSSALIVALTGRSVESICGGGAFAARTINEDAVIKKVDIVTRALNRCSRKNMPAAVALANLGGAEIAALVGAMLEAADRNVAVLVDGFIATAAALVAVSISPNVCHVLFLTSTSAEKGQRAAIDQIQVIATENNVPVPASPVLSMNLRMGEGTAALLSVPILQSAAAIMQDMATIQDILSNK